MHRDQCLVSPCFIYYEVGRSECSGLDDISSLYGGSLLVYVGYLLGRVSMERVKR